MEIITQAVDFFLKLPGGRITAAFVEFLVLLAVFYVVYRVLFYILKKASEKTKTDFDDNLINSLKDPAVLFFVVTSAFLALSSTYPGLSVGGVGANALYPLLLMAIGAFAVDRVVCTVLAWYQSEIAPKTNSTLDDELVPLIRKVLRIVIYAFAIVMILGNLGIEVTPLLAGLGIASLAVALALQDSLGNFFAGINISVDRPLKKGDFVSTDGGIEGVVQELGWRSTRILNLQNSIVVIPNTKLAQSVITNFYKPDQKVLQYAEVGVSYDQDVEHVAQAIKNAIKRAAEKSTVLSNSREPLVRFYQFGDFSLNFRAAYEINDYGSKAAALDEVNRAIFYEFKKEGISIPFPTRTVYSVQPPPLLSEQKVEQKPEPQPEPKKAKAAPRQKPAPEKKEDEPKIEPQAETLEQPEKPSEIPPLLMPTLYEEPKEQKPLRKPLALERFAELLGRGKFPSEGRTRSEEKAQIKPIIRRERQKAKAKGKGGRQKPARSK